MPTPRLLLDSFMKQGNIPIPLQTILLGFIKDYMEVLEKKGGDFNKGKSLLATFIRLIEEEIQDPTVFQTYHQRIDKPFDYYRFGIDLFKPIVVFEESTVKGLNIVDEIVATVNKKENAILLANHQTEPDPQAISMLLDKTHPEFAKEIIFVAGHRVTTDPLAIPFSKGRNLICIFSKKRIEQTPEDKEKKLLHNQKAMLALTELLKEGGKCVYVAPSGGRDRLGPDGNPEVAPFDPQSIEMFRLIALKAKTPTHFYPLALSTYDLLPPPGSVENTFGEARTPSSTPIHLAFGKRIDFEKEIRDASLSKEEARKRRAELAHQKVKDLYLSIEGA